MSNHNPKNQFQPGVSGNPKGGPKKEWTWAGLIREQLEKVGTDGKEVKHAVSASLVAKALEGDVQAIKEVGNRLDGMPAQGVNVNQTGEFTLVIKDYTENPDLEKE